MQIDDAKQLWDPRPGWLNTASYGLPARPAWEALQAALADWRVGATSWERWDEATVSAREALARLVGVSSTDAPPCAPVGSARRFTCTAPRPTSTWHWTP